MQLPFDPEDPPAEPPAGCDQLTWRLAYQIYRDHDLGPDGRCRARACRDAFEAAWPCGPRSLAEHGLLAAVGAWAGIDLGVRGRWFAQVPPRRVTQVP